MWAVGQIWTTGKAARGEADGLHGQRPSAVGEADAQVPGMRRAVCPEHRRAPVTAIGKVGRDAARYSAEQCRAIFHGVGDGMKHRGIYRAGEVGLHAVADEDTDPDPDKWFSGTYRDDISGQTLRDDLVHGAG